MSKVRLIVLHNVLDVIDEQVAGVELPCCHYAHRLIKKETKRFLRQSPIVRLWGYGELTIGALSLEEVGVPSVLYCLRETRLSDAAIQELPDDAVRQASHIDVLLGQVSLVEQPIKIGLGGEPGHSLMFEG